MRCKHCYLGEYKHNIENYYIDILIEDFRKNKVPYVTLTGGEPLINKDFQTIIRKLYNNGITTYIATNGTLLDIEKVNFLIENCVKLVQISLDGASKDINDRLRGKGTFDNVISNLQMMKRLGLKVIVACTINKNNINYINEFINLKKFIEFDFLRFELYIPVINRFDELALSHDDINKIRCIFNSLKKDNSVILPKFNSEIMCGAGIVNCMILKPSYAILIAIFLQQIMRGLMGPFLYMGTNKYVDPESKARVTLVSINNFVTTGLTAIMLFITSLVTKYYDFKVSILAVTIILNLILIFSFTNFMNKLKREAIKCYEKKD